MMAMPALIITTGWSLLTWAAWAMFKVQGLLWVIAIMTLTLSILGGVWTLAKADGERSAK